MARLLLRRRRETVAALFLLAMALSQAATVFDLVPSLRKGYQNFTIFYGAGRMVLQGQTAGLYDLSAQYEVQQQFAPDVKIRHAALPFNHPPFEALLFAPFAPLPYWPAYLFWTLVNLILLAVSLAVLRAHFPEIRRLSPVLVALAAAAFSPIVNSFIQGHDCVLLLFLYVLALAAFERHHDVAAGALLAAGLFRFQLVLPLVVILAIRRWRLLLGFVPVAAVLAGVSVAMIGWHGAVDYVRTVLSLEKTGAGGSIVAAGMPNLRGIIAGFPGFSSAAVMLLTVASSLAAVALAMWRIRSGRDSARFSFLLATLIAVLVSYHALLYDLSLLFPALLLLYAAAANSERLQRNSTMFLILLFLIPRFDWLGPSLTPFVWFTVFLGWLLSQRATTPPLAQPQSL